MINDDFEQNKSPHFREKYLVLSYLKTNTWDNCRRMYYWTKHDFVSHPLPLLSFILFFLQTLNQTQQKQHHEDIHMLSCFRRNYCQSPSIVASRVKTPGKLCVCTILLPAARSLCSPSFPIPCFASLAFNIPCTFLCHAAYIFSHFLLAQLIAKHTRQQFYSHAYASRLPILPAF